MKFSKMEEVREVEGTLKPEERCTICIRGNIVRNLEKDRRLIALIKFHRFAAVFIYSYSGEKPLASNLQVEYALPINKDFSASVERNAEEIQAYGREVTVRIIAQKGVRLVVEFKSGENVANFMMELKKAINTYKDRAVVAGESTFKWLENRATEMFKPTENDDILEQSSYDNPLILLKDLPCETTQKNDMEDEIEDAMYNNVSPVLSGNEATPRSRPERASFSYSLPDRNASPVNFRTERDTFVRLMLGERENEFVNINQMRFLVCTWNVNGQEPTANLAPWFTTEEGAPDVIAIGFQELDLSAEALMGRDSKREAEWLTKVKKGLSKINRYRTVDSVRLVGMLLVVVIKECLVEHVHEVDVENVGTGIMGMMGNKGGVAVRFRLFNTSVCFVNSHLAAHQEEVDRRNQDYRDISTRLRFPKYTLAIADHDVVFWFGDLNYRIDYYYDGVMKFINDGNYHELLERDQLMLQMRNDKCFPKYKEGMITFQPTYKYNPGTDDWDSEKDRTPAWCDRVLWWTSRNNSVQQMAYTSQPQLKISDHKPVSALFNVNVKVVDKKKEKTVLEDVVRQLDKRENDFLPQVELSIKELKFGKVMFLEKITKSFEIKNIGQVAVQYAFVKKLEEKHICKPWLTIEPFAGLVKQNDCKTVDITVFVDKDTAGPLTVAKETLEDILVLHLQGGRDIFIPISATYIPSVFGSCIETLVHLYIPIRDAPVGKLIELDVCDAAPMESKALELPKELWLLVDHLQKNGFEERNIFRKSALEGELQKIRDHLDTKADGNLPGNIHSVAEALLVFIETLGEPVIPFHMYQKCLDCSNNYTLCKQMVNKLPTSHKNVFTYLIEFLKELLVHSKENGLDSKVLATIFGTIMLRPPANAETLINKKAMQQVYQKRAKFIHHFIYFPSVQ